MLILPLHKEDHAGVPFMTLAFTVVCVAVHFLASDELKDSLAYRPETWNVLTMFTSDFVHSDLLHLAGNLFFFVCFAGPIESEMKTTGYLLAFALFSITTAVLYSLSAAEPIPTVGLSGVVWGYMGMFLMRFPTENIRSFLWILVFVRIVNVPAFLFVLAFLGFEVADFNAGEEDGINHIAHLAGFGAGVFLKFAFWSLLTVPADTMSARPRRPSPPPRPRRKW